MLVEASLAALKFGIELTDLSPHAATVLLTCRCSFLCRQNPGLWFHASGWEMESGSYWNLCSYVLQEAVMTFFIVIPVRNYFIHSLNQLLDLL